MSLRAMNKRRSIGVSGLMRDQVIGLFGGPLIPHMQAMLR